MHKRYTIDDYLKLFNDLYITERKKFIQQKADGSYSHISAYKLNDGVIREHLEQKKTIGVFAGKHITKFITFDVDFADLEQAGQATRELVIALEEQFYISHDSILVSFSGSKGYHVTLFFDEVIDNNKAKQFYDVVINYLGYESNQIEFRATNGQGVKLPLSINRKSNRRQYLVNPYTLKRIADSNIFKIEKINKQLFIDYLDEFKEDEKPVFKEDVKTDVLDEKRLKEFEKIVEKTNLNIPIDYESRVMQILEENHLIHQDSRHISTLLMLIFLAQQGYSEADAIMIVQSVIKNTYENHRELIDSDRTLDFCLSEVKRLWQYACKYNLGHETQKNIVIYENEILEVLKPKKIQLKQLLFILLVHSKRHAKKDGTFFMTYKQMAEYGATDNRTRALKYLLELEEMGLIKIVERQRKQKNSKHLLPNLYKVNICIESENFIELDTTNKSDVKLETTVVKLIPSNKLKKIVSKRQFENTFKHYYIS